MLSETRVALGISYLLNLMGSSGILASLSEAAAIFFLCGQVSSPDEGFVFDANCSLHRVLVCQACSMNTRHPSSFCSTTKGAGLKLGISTVNIIGNNWYNQYTLIQNTMKYLQWSSGSLFSFQNFYSREKSLVTD